MDKGGTIHTETERTATHRTGGIAMAQSSKNAKSANLAPLFLMKVFTNFNTNIEKQKCILMTAN